MIKLKEENCRIYLQLKQQYDEIIEQLTNNNITQLESELSEQMLKHQTEIDNGMQREKSLKA